MSKLNGITLSVTGKIASVSDNLVHVVILADDAFRKKYGAESRSFHDCWPESYFCTDDKKGWPLEMNESFVYEEGLFNGQQAALYERIRIIGTVEAVDGDSAVLGVDAGAGANLLKIINPERTGRCIKKLNVRDIRGDVKEKKAVLLSSYKIIAEGREDIAGIDYVILSNRERHFKKDN